MKLDATNGATARPGTRCYDAPMGTWGAGNLDDDTALDEVGERSDALITQLWERIQKQESWEADEWECAALFVDLESLLALEAGGVFSGYSLPSRDKARPVIDRWLAGWGAYFDGLAPREGFKAERRAVIEQTFERFLTVCDKYAD